MPDVRIHRTHRLGALCARELARQWMSLASAKFGLEFTPLSGEVPATGDEVVRFHRNGLNGTVRVGAEDLEVTATLGLLLGAFGSVVEVEIARQLDRLLCAPPAGGGTT